MRKFTHLEIINAYKQKGYHLNDAFGEINIFGIRNNDPHSNAFDDCVGILKRVSRHSWLVLQYEATTDPGLYYRENPFNKDGTAIVVPDFHKNCYKVGKHRGYEAMEQIAPMHYVRDSNKNKVLDFLYKVTGYKRWNQNGKTNIHKAGKRSKQVDKWSAGCQVLANELDFNEFISVIKNSRTYRRANVFSYALFQIEDIKIGSNKVVSL